MRHLPSSTPLRRVADIEARRLLGELLRLPDEVDALRWLQVERGPVAARNVLGLELRRLRFTVKGIQDGVEQGWPVPERYTAMLGGLLELDVEAQPFVRLDEDGPPGPEELVSILRELRDLRGQRAGDDVAPRDPNDHDALLLDLLQLPGSVDPLRWLQGERDAVMARVALAHLLESFRPPQTFEVGPMARARVAHRAWDAPKGVHISIKEFAFGQRGFRFSASVGLSMCTVALPEVRGEGLIVEWAGFDRVLDNLGNRYLVQYVDLSTGSQILWRRWQKLRMAFYPAVAPGATELTFMARPMTLSVLGFNVLAGRLRYLPDYDVGDVTWRVSVPA